jgi:Zn-dependent protease with chaperone function
MNTLVHPRELSLGRLTLVLGLIAWLVLIVGTFGIALVYILLAFVAYVFAQSALIAWLRGTGLRLSSQQFPELHQRYTECCRKLGVSKAPEAYVISGGGLLNAFATRFLGRDFVVLLSDVVDALEPHPDGVDFYIGHELGHVVRKHLTGHLWRWPVLWLPLLGAAYSRAKESTCDLHGLACSSSPENAARAMMVLAAGQHLWARADLAAYVQQAHEARGFWSSFHEIISGYPWLTKRLARVLHGPQVQLPGRHGLAYALAVFVPHAGRLGGGAGFIIAVAMIGVLAAVALPAYQQYQQRAVAAQAWVETAPVRQALAGYFEKNGQPPESLAQAGAPTAFQGRPLDFNPDNMVVVVPLKAGALELVPRLDEQKRVFWNCAAGEGLQPAALPVSCR